MTITVSTNAVTWQGNGATTVFSYNFPMPAGCATLLYTTAAGVQTVVAPGAYTITGVGQPTAGGGQQGGSVTYPLTGSPIPAGSLLTLIRTVPNTQPNSFSNQSGLWASVVESSDDWIAMQAQQIQNIANRSITVNVADPVPSPLPTAAARAGQYLTFDASGNPTTGLPAGSSVVVSTPMQPVVAGASTLAASNLMLANGMTMTLAAGCPASAMFVGSGATANFWGSVLANAASPTVPEITAQFAMNSNVGLANHITAYKIGLAYSCVAGASSADIYGGNINMQGYGGSYLVTGLEVDVNNVGVDAIAVGGLTAVYGVVAVAAGSAKSTAGFWSVATSGGMWWDGIAITGNVGSAAFYEGASSPIGINIAGTHTTGISMLAGYPISVAMALPNNTPIQQMNASSTLCNIANVDTSSNMILGDSHLAQIYALQSINPYGDNTYSLGISGKRWSAVWAASGTIQTSDPTLKTAIAPLPAMLPLVMSIEPKSYRWKSGGQVLQDAQEEQDVHLTETQSVVVKRTTVEAGVAVEREVTEQQQIPLYDDLPVVDATGAPVMAPHVARTSGAAPGQLKHRVPRMGKQTVTVQRAVDVPGKRTHVGFLAPDVKAGLDTAGVDYGAYVKAEDGTEALRPDQLLVLLWKAFQEHVTASEATIADLNARLNTLMK